MQASGANGRLKLMHEMVYEDAVENHPLSNGFALCRYGPKTNILSKTTQSTAMLLPDAHA